MARVVPPSARSCMMRSERYMISAISPSTKMLRPNRRPISGGRRSAILLPGLWCRFVDDPSRSVARSAEDQFGHLFRRGRILSGHQLAVTNREGLEARSVLDVRPEFGETCLKEERDRFCQPHGLFLCVGESAYPPSSDER